MREWYEQRQSEGLATSEFWELCAARAIYQKDYLSYWQHMDGQTASGRRVDGVIQPVSPCVAGRQNDFQYYTYSAIANVLDFPAAAFPVPTSLDLSPYEMARSASPLSHLSDEDLKMQAICVWCRGIGEKIADGCRQIAQRTYTTCLSVYKCLAVDGRKSMYWPWYRS